MRKKSQISNLKSQIPSPYVIIRREQAEVWRLEDARMLAAVMANPVVKKAFRFLEDTIIQGALTQDGPASVVTDLATQRAYLAGKVDAMQYLLRSAAAEPNKEKQADDEEEEEQETTPIQQEKKQ